MWVGNIVHTTSIDKPILVSLGVYDGVKELLEVVDLWELVTYLPQVTLDHITVEFLITLRFNDDYGSPGEDILHSSWQDHPNHQNRAPRDLWGGKTTSAIPTGHDITPSISTSFGSLSQTWATTAHTPPRKHKSLTLLSALPSRVLRVSSSRDHEDDRVQEDDLYYLFLMVNGLNDLMTTTGLITCLGYLPTWVQL